VFKRMTAVLVGTLVLAGGAYAYAADSPSTAPPSASAPAAPHPGQDHRGPLRRAVHGDLIVRTKAGFENVTVDRGKVTAVSATSITIERPDGVSVTKAVTSDTRFRGVDAAEQVERGKGALVVSKGNTAVLIAQRHGDTPAPD
jgi:hypothetical protein